MEEYFDFRVIMLPCLSKNFKVDSVPVDLAGTTEEETFIDVKQPKTRKKSENLIILY